MNDNKANMMNYCKHALEHKPETVCEYCKLEVDQYGNTEEDFPNCCFPDCGCDGARNCMAENEANSGAMALNREKGSRHYE